MMRRFVTGLLAATGLFLFAQDAGAQEIQLTGPLKGAPAVRRLRLYREGRFELALGSSFTLLDEYRRTIVGTGRITYNIKDWLGIGVWGGYGLVSITTDLTDQIDANANKTDPKVATNVNRGKFEDQTAQMKWIAAPQLTFVPFRGKLAIFQKIFVDTDFYVSGGWAFIGVDERRDCGPGVGGGAPSTCTTPESFRLEGKMRMAPTFGLGFSFYIGNLLSLGLEYRALPFSWNRAGFDNRGAPPDGKFPDNKINSEDQTFKWNQLIAVTLGFSFPTAPKISE
jgi:outer membrane beta-barrel protein